MNAQLILEDTKKHFPLIRKDNEEFDVYYSRIINDFLNIVEKSEELFGEEYFDESEYVKLGRAKFICELKLFSELISQSISEYLIGRPKKAYEKLEKAMNSIRYHDGKLEYFQGFQITRNASYRFYRIRESDTRQAFSRKELFHVPFSKRRQIHTKRYSIPGLPSLYLSNSVYVAWEELNRPKFESIHASLFVLEQNLNCLNLTTDIYVRTESIHSTNRAYDNLISAIFRFPLVLACSVKVNNSKDVFRPEYIVPQMLLQWVSEEDNDMGIAYSSSHVDLTNNNYDGRFRNYVIPVKTHNKEYCSELSQMFKMTEALSVELHTLNRNPTPQVQMGGGSEYTNSQVKSIEIIKGQQSKYENTAFSFLEGALAKLPIDKIDFCE
jgi:hypothetical protein